MKKGVQKGSVSPKTIQQPKTLFDITEKWLGDKKTGMFVFILLLSFVFSVLLFNARITESHDDSLYIEAGYNYAKDFFHYYFLANAPLYPMLLSIPIAIFGIQLLYLKLFSLIFNFFHIFFFYKAWKGRLPYLILFPVLLITATNSLILYFASQTYTESFFLLIQSLFFLYFFKLNDKIEANNSLKSNLKLLLVVGFVTFILTLTKNVSIVVIPIVVTFFLFYKQYLNAVYFVLSFLIFKIPFEILKYLIWHKVGQYSQTNILFLKDPYDASKGSENFSGFVDRFFTNADLYISKRFFQIIGFMSENNITVNKGLTFIVTVIVIIAGFFAYKQKNKALVLGIFYTIVMCATTFVTLQIRWDQPRYIMVVMPFILFGFFYVFFLLLRKSSTIQIAYIYIILMFVGVNLYATTKKAGKNFPILKRNLKGDIYYGYTEDWVNYFKMSEWCGKNLPKTAFVACRKAPMSFVYSNGREFFPVYYARTTDPDSVLAYFKKNNVTHILIANLRKNPNVNNGEIINTMHRMFGPVQQKYPQKLNLIHQEGVDEAAYLFEIKY